MGALTANEIVLLPKVVEVAEIVQDSLWPGARVPEATDPSVALPVWTVAVTE